MSKHGRIVGALTAVVVAVVVALACAPSASATPYTNRPKLKLSSTIVVVFHYVAVTGTGYVPNENVTISIDTPANVQKVVKADSAGHFITNVLPGATGQHKIIGTGQFAHDGFDVAKATIIVIGNLLGVGALAYERPLAGSSAPSNGASSSPDGGLAVVLGIAAAAIIALGSGGYILLSVRRRTTER